MQNDWLTEDFFFFDWQKIENLFEAILRQGDRNDQLVLFDSKNRNIDK